MSDRPLVFISHKHSDREIAETLARFVRTRSAGNVRVHLSSSPDFEGPRFGQPLNNELKRVLADTALVILVYTSDTEDWSYCMWECGIATDPSDQRMTRVVVIQCTGDKPKPYGDQLRVNAADLDSVYAFVKALLTSTEFFDDEDEPITGFAPEGQEIQEFAAELHKTLASVLPSGAKAERATPSSPYLRIRLSDQAAGKLREAYLAKATDECEAVLAAEGEIVEQVEASSLFRMQIVPGTKLSSVLANLQDIEDAERTPRWFSSLADQVEAALVGHLRPVQWAPYRTAAGRVEVPFVASSRRTASGSEFDVYMVAITPRPVLVSERMLVMQQVQYLDAAKDRLDELRVMGVVKDMAGRKLTRLPILDDGRAKTVVHKATMNDFLVQAIETGNAETLTLKDLLEMRAESLEGSYVEVPADSTMEQAKEKMASTRGCQDVFVTRDGRVVGWLPNVMFI